MTLAAWLLSLAGPMLIKALIAIGVGTLAFTGVNEALHGLIQIAQSSWGGVPADVAALAGLAGIPECIGLIAGP